MVILQNSGGGIDPSEATATPDKVLQGETFFAGDDEVKEGSIPIRTGDTNPITTQSRRYEAGYYNAFTVNAPVQIEKDADITLNAGATTRFDPGYNPKTTVVRGWQPANTSEGITIYPSKSEQKISAGTYLKGAATIKAVSASNLSAGNIKSGTKVTVSGGNGNLYEVTGTYVAVPTLTNTPTVKKTSSNTTLEFTGLVSGATYIVVAAVTGQGTGSTSWYTDRNSSTGWSSVGGDDSPSWTSDSAPATFTKMWKFVASDSYKSFKIGVSSKSSFYNYSLAALCLRI